MMAPPSLAGLCRQAMAELLNRDAERRKELSVLPPDLLADLIPLLSPLCIESLQTEADYRLSFPDSCGHPHITLDSNEKRSFCTMMHGYRLCCFNGAWRNQFSKRWPTGFKKARFDNLLSFAEVQLLGLHDDEALIDWRQRYWEAHLQECLNEAIAQTLTTHHQKTLSTTELPSHLLQMIGCIHTNTVCLLKHACWQFGTHVRYLRLRGAICSEELSIVLASCKNLGHLVCSHVDTIIQVEGLCSLLSQNRGTLHVLEFHNCRFSEHGLLKIRGSLLLAEDHCSLYHLFVHSSRRLVSEDSNSSIPCFFLQACRCLHSLVLIDNQVDDATSQKMLSTISTNMPNLSVLHVRESEDNYSLLMALKASAFEQRFQKNVWSSLKSLDIRSNNLSSQKLGKLLSNFHFVPLLELLNLSDNPIGDHGLIALLPVLQVLQLSELNLSACNLSTTGVCSLLDFIIDSKRSLQSLSLSDNFLGSSMAVPLVNFLHHGFVERLDIGDIGLGTDGCLDLQSALNKIPSLSHLIVRKNRLGFSGVTLLSKLMAIPNCLKTIDLSSNLLDRECLKRMVLELKRLHGGILELLDLRNNLSDDLRLFENIKKPMVLLSEASMLHDDDP